MRVVALLGNGRRGPNPLLAGLLLLTFHLGPAAAAGEIALRLLGTYDSGLGEGAAEISAYDPASQRLFVVNATHGGVDIVDLREPTSPSLVTTVDLSAFGTSANSVTAAGGVIAVAVQAGTVDGAGRLVFLDADGAVLNSVEVGVLPDMAIFTPDGDKVLVANEGEPSGDYTVDPEGSVSIVDLAAGVARATVSQVRFTAFDGQEEALRAQGVRLFGPKASASQDLEPEYIAISPDGTTAYVALQENNALAVIDIARATVTRIAALGFKDHDLEGNGLDASNRDNAIAIRPWPVLGIYLPDGLAAYAAGGQTYLVSANEGDTREYDGFGEEARVADLTLDPQAYPEAAELQSSANLGRLKTTTTLGDADGDGDVDQIYTFGARSFSIWNGAGELVFDSGDDFEQITARLLPEGFNADSGQASEFDERSDDKGPEPEGVVLGQVDGRTYAFVGLERTGGVMVYDVTDPRNAAFVTYANTRDFAAGTGDVSPEGLLFIPAADSPSGNPLLVASHEISGTVAIFAVEAPQPLRLTILHNNDGESQLLDAGSGLEDFGGVARFKSLVDRLRRQTRIAGRGVLMLSSGDNFLAGPEFNVSTTAGTYYDAVALDLIGYDAICLGNHDFDFGPEVLADFIATFASPTPYLSANLDFSREPDLQALADLRRIASSAVVEVDGQRIGVVGFTTPDLPFISSPRQVRVSDQVVQLAQAEIDRLAGLGIDKIVLISHLQSVNNDLELIPQLRGVDVAIAGGGDELLANPQDLLAPGDQANPDLPYPLVVTGADGREVLVVTTAGDYRYVGRLEVEFDAEGQVVSFAGGPVRVAGGDQPDAVDPDPELQERVVEPVQAGIAALASQVIGTSEVALDGQRNAVRARESNEGNLIADALLWQARELAADFGVRRPDIALQNGGGIRNNNLIAAGQLTTLSTFDMLPFPNFVAVVEDIPAAQLKEILENAVSQVENGAGRFAQVAGLSFVWNPEGAPQEIDPATGRVAQAGSRIVDVTLDDGRRIVVNGRLLRSAPTVTVATIDFLARDGDQYPFQGAPFVTLGVSYQQALANYIVQGLDGRIRAAEYPAGGEGRIATGAPRLSPAELRRRVVVAVTLTGEAAQPLAGVRVEFARAVSGRTRAFAWEGTTDVAGRTEVQIDASQFNAASGLYEAQVVDPVSSAILGRWNSIPLNGGRRLELVLPIGGPAAVTSQQPLAPAAKLADAETEQPVPVRFGLQGNYPNPFNATTQIVYHIATSGEARLTVYNFLGQQVRVLAQGFHSAGAHQVTWDGRDAQGHSVATGLYFYRLEHAEGTQVRQMLLLK